MGDTYIVSRREYTEKTSKLLTTNKKMAFLPDLVNRFHVIFEVMMEILSLVYLVTQRESRWNIKQDKDVLISMFSLVGASIIINTVTLCIPFKNNFRGSIWVNRV